METTILESQMEKQMENEMETGTMLFSESIVATLA